MINVKRDNEPIWGDQIKDFLLRRFLVVAMQRNFISE